MNKGRPVRFAAGERLEEYVDDEARVDKFQVAAQRARLPRGMREVGVSGGAPPPESGDEATRFTYRLYFEVNATILGRLLGTDPDTWLDEYLLFARMRAAGVVKGIIEYKSFFPTGQVEQATGEFDDLDRADELFEEVMRPICQGEG